MITRDGAEDVGSIEPTKDTTKEKVGSSSDIQNAELVETYYTRRVYWSSTVTILRKETNVSIEE